MIKGKQPKEHEERKGGDIELLHEIFDLDRCACIDYIPLGLAKIF